MCPSSLLDFQLCIFWSLQSHTKESLRLDSVPQWLPIPRKNIQAYSFVTVYCMDFKIFLSVILKLFSLTFVPSSHEILGMPLSLRYHDHNAVKVQLGPTTKVITRIIILSQRLPFWSFLEFQKRTVVPPNFAQEQGVGWLFSAENCARGLCLKQAKIEQRLLPFDTSRELT